MAKFTLEGLAHRSRERVRNDFDAVICISGPEGMGKSSCALNLAKMIDPEFDLGKHVAYNSQQVKDLLLSDLPPYSVILIDEGTSAMYKRDSAKGIMKQIIKILSNIRFKNYVIIICAPRLVDLDIQLREHRIALSLFIGKRGKGFVFFKDPQVQMGSGDPWHLGDSKMRKKHCFKGVFNFPDMPPEMRAEYDRIKDSNFVKLKSEYEDQPEPKKEKITLLKGNYHLKMHQAFNISYKKQAEAFGITPNSIRSYVTRYKKDLAINVGIDG